eukprot:m.502676 g.502676  ORF g.502676 m.502676 type:complete len:421 (+) comp57340_c0_seq7:272-1534(+)
MRVWQATLVLCAAIGAALAQSTLSGGWTEGGDGEGDCNAICAQKSLPCNQNAMRAVTNDNFQNLAARVPYVAPSPPWQIQDCVNFPTIIQWHCPSYNRNNRNCNRNSSLSTCASQGSVNIALRRVCCCSSSAACPLTPLAPVDCVVSGWSEWSACTGSCAGGVQGRTREVTTSPQDGGLDCPALTETQTCNTFSCPVDCVWGEWSNFGSCSQSCEGGNHTRGRSHFVEAAYGGVECTGPSSETEECNAFPCPVDCVLSDWTDNTPCSVTCGEGTQTRSRTVVVPAAFGGQACSENVERTRVCHKFICPGSRFIGEACDFNNNCEAGAQCNLYSGENLGLCIDCSSATGRPDGCRCFPGAKFAGMCAGICGATAPSENPHARTYNTCQCASGVNKAVNCPCTAGSECQSGFCNEAVCAIPL